MPTPFGFGNGLPTLDEFFQAQRDGWVASKTRKTADGRTYRIFNYTKRTQFKRTWTPVTLEARGLIYCQETSDIVALPMTKFFNLGERISDTQVATIQPGPFEALVKMDGALGIGYRMDEAVSWATRGSFNSPQAEAAQAIWDTKYKQHNSVLLTEWNHITPLVEIIHPVSRVVVKYDFQDLVLIAAKNRFTGEDMPYECLVEMSSRLGMRVVERFGSEDLDALLQRVSEMDSNHEGVVIKQGDNRLKAKGDEYKRVHRLLSGVTPQNIALAWLSDTHEEMLVAIPEEFRDSAEKNLAELDTQLVASVLNTEAVYATAPQGDQREFASWVSTNHKQLSAQLFVRRMYDDSKHVELMATGAVAVAVQTGRIHSLLGESRYEPLRTHLLAYEQSVGNTLWHFARNEDTGAQLQLELRKLPHKALRSAMATAIMGLQPDLVVAKLAEYLQQPDQIALYGELDCQAIFAKAPAPDSAQEHHLQWIAEYPPQLRSFLDSWRYRGQRQTATNEARGMLAAAIRNNCVAGAGPCQLELTELATQVSQLINELRQLWSSMPHQEGPQALLHCARDSTNAWASILLNQAWSAHRQAVCDRFIAAHKNDVTAFDDA